MSMCPANRLSNFVIMAGPPEGIADRASAAAHLRPPFTRGNPELLAAPPRRDQFRPVNSGGFGNAASDAVDGGGLLRLQHHRSRRCASGWQQYYCRSQGYGKVQA